MTLSEATALLISCSHKVAKGGSVRNNSRYVVRNIAQAAANDSGKPIGVYLDSLGFFCTSREVTRSDASLIFTIHPQGVA